MSMTHGTNGTKTSDAKSSDETPPRPPSSQGSSAGSSGSSKHVKCIGRYVLTGCTLGKGNFARVEAAVHTLTRAKVAIKIIETDKIKEDYVKKNLLREAQLMRRLRHPNVIRLYETMKTSNLYCLVTEIAEGGELLSHVRSDFKEKRLTEATTRPFVRQLVSALHHLHSFGIVHRDLKMENILLDKKKRTIKIVDFGLSNAAKPGGLLQTHCGSPEYAAPELFIPGREYGAEVDVWSLGVNMYAMLVGKLPFRSPRQGSKRRQKLLEQISGGLTESHEREMAHISKGAINLIFRLLQPDPRRRIVLEEVMVHPWVTKDGMQPLQSYKPTPPDPRTQGMVVELMSTVLEVSPAEIKETVRRDRCDWVAAIYNLLHDQPEGQSILQRLITEDQEDELMDAAHHYQSSTEHIRLSQGDFLDNYSPEVAHILSNASAQAKRHQSGRRLSMSQPDSHVVDEYASSTLPLTKREKRRHSMEPSHQLDATPHQLGQTHHMQGRRASIASSSHTHSSHLTPIALQQKQQIGHAHTPHPHMQGLHSQSIHNPKRRVLPMTPTENPYQPPGGVLHSHSRAESAPDPLPVPWRSNIAPHNQLVPIQQPQYQQYSSGGSLYPPPAISPPTSPKPTGSHENNSPKMLPPVLKEPLISTPTSPQAAGSIYGSSGKHSSSKKKLRPLRTKSGSVSSRPIAPQLSKSIDGLNLHPMALVAQPGSHTMSGMTWQQVHAHQTRRNSLGGGWAQSAGHNSQRLGHPADIKGFMANGVTSPYNSLYEIHKIDARGGSTSPHGCSNTGSITSVEINTELFAPGSKGGSEQSSQIYSSNTTPIGSKGSSPQGPSPLGPSPQASKSHFRQGPVEQAGPNQVEHPYYHHSQNQALGGGVNNDSQQVQQGWQVQKALPPAHASHRATSAKPSARLHQVTPDHSMSVVYSAGASHRESPDVPNGGHNLPKIPNSQMDKGQDGNHVGVFGGILGKAFKSTLKKEKSASMTLPSRQVVDT